MKRSSVASLVALAFVVVLVGAPAAATASGPGAPANNSTATPTPSPTATPTPNPTPTATPTPTAAPTTSPTASPTATPTATLTPMATPASQADESADDSSGWTYEGLRQDGTHQDVPSVRMADVEKRSYWLVYWSANNPFANVGDPTGGKYMPENHTLGRDTIYIRTWTYVDRPATIHLVFWTKDQREVERGNATITEPYAKNVKHIEREVTFDRGRPTVAVDIPSHHNRKRVTMWIEGAEWARWTFAHKSLATTQGKNIDSEGDYLAAAISDFLLWIVVGGFAIGYLCRKALEYADAGPQYGYTPWVIGLTLLTGFGCLMFFRNVAALVVNAQYILSVYVIGIIGIVMLETYSGDVNKTLLLQPTLEHSESPKGEHAFDFVDVKAEEIKTVRSTDGTVSVVTPGFFPFLARAFTGAARIHNVEDLETRANMVESKWDEMFVVDPEADELIEYEPESWTFSVPPMDREHAPTWGLVALGLGVAGLAIHQQWVQPYVVIGVTALSLLAWAATPIKGLGYVEPAPVHIRSAFATMLNFAEDVDDAKRFDELKRQIDKERLNKQRDVDREVRNHDRTLVEESYDPDENVPAAIEQEDYSDDEVVEQRRENGTTAVPDGGDDDDD